MHLQPGHFPFGPPKGAFYREQFVVWPRVLIIMVVYSIARAINPLKNPGQSYKSNRKNFMD